MLLYTKKKTAAECFTELMTSAHDTMTSAKATSATSSAVKTEHVRRTTDGSFHHLHTHTHTHAHRHSAGA